MFYEIGPITIENFGKDGPWFLYEMVAQAMLCTHEGRQVFLDKDICECSQSKQMPLTAQITEIAPYVRTCF